MLMIHLHSLVSSISGHSCPMTTIKTTSEPHSLHDQMIMIDPRMSTFPHDHEHSWNDQDQSWNVHIPMGWVRECI
jgi:hypothetical protein